MTIVVCLVMMFRTAERLVFSVQSFNIASDSVTVGKASDVCFEHVPHDFLTVVSKDGHFEWNVNKDCYKSDSLMYYTVNNVNPNFHTLNGGSLVVQIPQRLGCRPHSVTLSSEELNDLLDGPEAKYVLVRTLLQMRADRDTTIDYTAIKQIRSCIGRKTKESPWGVVLLDKYTSYVHPDGQSATYAMCGRTDSLGDNTAPANTFKIQFYRMSDYTIMPLKVDDDLFHIGRMHFLAKPVLATTKWGAGHAMIVHEPSGRGLIVKYPKALTYVERIDSLRSYGKSSSGLLTYEQSMGSFPVTHNLFLPAYSSALSQDVCNLRVTPDTLGVVMPNDSVRLLKGQFRFLPTLQSLELPHGGLGVTHAKVGVIDKWFIMSYLWLPLLIFVILFFAYPVLTQRDINEKRITDKATNLPSLFQCILLITLAFGVCKTMVAFKLSYTYPYFEKMTGIIPISVSFMLLLVYNLSLVFNHRFITRSSKRWRKLAAPGISIVCVVIILLALKAMDSGFNADTIASYYQGELGGLNPLNWDKAVGMNDTHRSVPFMLLVANLLATLLLVVLTHLFTNKNKNNQIKRGFWPTLALGCVVVFAVSLLPGNYSTAGITLSAVLCLNWTMGKIDYRYPQSRPSSTRASTLLQIIRAIPLDGKSFGLTMLACFLFFVAAISKGDKGYLTNFAGYMVFGILVFIMVSKSRNMSEMSAVEREWSSLYQRGLKYAIFGVLALLVVGMLWIVPLFFNADSIDYERASRRFAAATQFEKYQDSGYRYAVSDAEFMIVMAHYMFNLDGNDPLSNTEHLLHPSISTGQSPVILNDVSIQSAFFGAYGLWSYVVFFVLLALLAWLVFKYTLTDAGELDVRCRWRMMAVLLWLSTSIYLYVSYAGLLPFTGRLVPGFGVDSVGEALETSILLALMTATSLHENNK